MVTGVGTVCGFGRGIDLLWEGLCAGKSCVGPIRAFDASGFESSQGVETPNDLDVRQIVPKHYRKATKVMARDIVLAVSAADSAVRSAGLSTRGTVETEGSQVTIAPSRMGCHIGAGLVACEVNELTAALTTSATADGSFDFKAWGSIGMQNLTPLWLLKYLPNMLACHVTIIHDCQGPSNTITCAEASSGLSMGESMRAIERGHADACLAGGAESKINMLGLIRQQFAGRLAAIATTDDGPRAVKPFDEQATGSVLGEGGGLLVLEGVDTATQRGATIRARLVGYSAGQCACADTLGLDLSEAAEDVAAVMQASLEDAHLDASQIDAIVPLGMGMRATDRAESEAIRAVFGSRAASIPLVTMVPSIGVCGAGAGALQAAVAVKCLEMQMIPARINASSTPGLCAQACESQRATLNHVMVVTPGLGGQVVSLIFGRAS